MNRSSAVISRLFSTTVFPSSTKVPASPGARTWQTVFPFHMHVIPRYADDPRPEWPFPFPAEEPPPFPDAELRADAQRLRAASKSTSPFG